MKTVQIAVILVLLACGPGLLSCSQSKDKESGTAQSDPRAEQTARDIRDQLRAPLNRAVQTQELGEERTKAVDEAVRQK